MHISSDFQLCLPKIFSEACPFDPVGSGLSRQCLEERMYGRHFSLHFQFLILSLRPLSDGYRNIR